jgi:hypothetical protein
LTAWFLEYGGHREEYKVVLWILRVVIVPLDSISNFLCVYLAFDFVASYYHSTCCILNALCHRIFENVIKKQIVRTLPNIKSNSNLIAGAKRTSSSLLLTELSNVTIDDDQRCYSTSTKHFIRYFEI